MTIQAVIENLKTLAYALLIAGIFRSLLFQPFWIPSGSMKDTLLIGDFLFVNKFAYGYSRHSCPWSLCPFSGRVWADEPERGDIVVFKHPVSRRDFIKRVVGLPGDKIQLLDGVLIINGEPTQRAPDGEFEEAYERQGPAGKLPRCTSPPTDGTCRKAKFMETFPEGNSHSVLEITFALNDTTEVFTVPEGEYFFMGDNRDNSQDSRYPQAVGGVGTVPFENLVGRADRVIFSSAGRSMLFFWTWRSDRFFKSIE